MISKLLARLFSEDAAATALEYAMIAGGLSIMIAAAVGGIGGDLTTIFGSVQTAIK